MNKDIKASICCITYNQKKYIRQCLDGFVMQRTNFKFEVLIHDDASTDGTTDIIREYEKKYPDIIKPIYQTENKYSRGISITRNYIYPNIKGKYVAICEGDDYWTDPYKLQKQVDFLDAHPDYSICFHPAKVIYEGFLDKHEDEIYPSNYKNLKPNIETLLEWNFIPTASVMYRWRFKEGEDLNQYYPTRIYASDIHMHLLHAKVGKIKMLPEVMSVYRKHPQGITSCFEGSWDALYLKHGLTMLEQYKYIYENITDFSENYKNIKLLTEFKNILSTYLINNKFDEVNTLINLYSNLLLDYLNNSMLIDNTGDLYKNKYKKYKKYFNLLLILSFILLITFTYFIFKTHFIWRNL